MPSFAVITPPYFSMQITSLEAAVRLAFAATSMALQGIPAQDLCGVPAAQLVCTALHEAVALIRDAARSVGHIPSMSFATQIINRVGSCRQAHQSTAAAWHWPPPEMAPATVQRWYELDRLNMLANHLHQFKLEAASLLQIASGALFCSGQGKWVAVLIFARCVYVQVMTCMHSWWQPIHC
jgi:hypothetical protein